MRYAISFMPFAAAALGALHDITFSHFITDLTAANAPEVDLSPWGYEGGQLPTVFHFSPNGLDYSAVDSHALFHDIVAGKKNRTSPSLEKRIYCPNSAQLDFDLTGINGCKTTYNGCSSANGCYSGDGCSGWTTVSLFRNRPSGFITFWTSDTCDGTKGSFNPTCQYDSNTATTCGLNDNLVANSYAVYDGCHYNYPSDGCQTVGNA